MFTSSGIDMQFLRAGLDLAQEAVYSLHKSTTREVCYFFLFAFLFKKKKFGSFENFYLQHLLSFAKLPWEYFAIWSYCIEISDIFLGF